MLKLFKSLGLGVFIVLTSPLWLAALVLLLVLIIIKYFIGEIASLISFFRGYDYIEDDEYEIALEEAMEEKGKEVKHNQPIYVQPIPNKYIDPRFFQDNLDEEGEEDE